MTIKYDQLEQMMAQSGLADNPALAMIQEHRQRMQQKKDGGPQLPPQQQPVRVANLDEFKAKMEHEMREKRARETEPAQPTQPPPQPAQPPPTQPPTQVSHDAKQLPLGSSVLIRGLAGACAADLNGQKALVARFDAASGRYGVCLYGDRLRVDPPAPLAIKPQNLVRFHPADDEEEAVTATWPEVHNALLDVPRDGRTSRACVARLHELSGSADEPPLACAPSVGALLAVMEKRRSSAEVQSHGCGVLYNLFGNTARGLAPPELVAQDRLKRDALASGAAAGVCAAMGHAAHVHSPAVQEAGCAALRNLAVYTHGEDKEALVLAGAFEALVRAMRAFPRRGALQEHACWAVAHLSCAPPAAYLQQDGRTREHGRGLWRRGRASEAGAREAVLSAFNAVADAGTGETRAALSALQALEPEELASFEQYWAAGGPGERVYGFSVSSTS